MGIVYHDEVEQGSEEWRMMRCGLLTASEMKLILTPTLKVASNEKEKTHLFELAAQRINQFVEPSFIGDDMMRGWEDEVLAAELYSEKYAETKTCGFITNDKWGFKIGYSPDQLVGDDGLTEFKSRKQKYQMRTIIENVVPEEYVLQIQTGLLVSEREWCDFGSYSGGMPFFVKRMYPDPVIQKAILDAAEKFEVRLKKACDDFKINSNGLHMTERRSDEEIEVI